MRIKFGFTQGLNVARLGLDETQILTAAQMADRLRKCVAPSASLR